MEAKIRDWLRKGNEAGHFVQRLSDIMPNPKIDFKVGDRVVFTNDYGVSFPDMMIIAIGKDNGLWKYGRCIYLDNDCYWFPVKPESLSFEAPAKKQTTGIKDLKLLCVDGWNRPVYRDINGRLWKDISLGKGRPQLYSACDNDIDGEPDMPITDYYPNF